MEGWSIGLKIPVKKGRRLIITHIGSSEGFVRDGLIVFESMKNGDYQQEMDATVFEEWFKIILVKLLQGSVIVMDNVSYHSGRVEKLPTSCWKKADITEWLQMKAIPFESTMLKAELLNLAIRHKSKFVRYVTDEMAKTKGMSVLRLPPYHCELNPIELV
ncbi:uncharacterized protein [Leptinotarsa decemlineata]|uniref:uncharacterized protein n=1 Tax=Leptinotarsa decemlineata TaxID=7539 RepID=UPI003D30B2AF